MAKILGKYQHVKNENMDEYFSAVGVPYIPRKMMSMSSPSMEITQDGDEWTIQTVSLMRTITIKFKSGIEYEEHMPNGEVLKSITKIESDNKLVTDSIVTTTEVKTQRTYDFDDNGCVITLTLGQVSGKRFFKRLV